MRFNGDKKYYNIEMINQIPIVEILRNYGYEPKVRYNDGWCSVRPEDDSPSFHININRNIWYDHGVNVGGGPIQVVQFIENCTKEDAVQILGNMFNVPTINDKNETFLSNAQFEKIGIQGDRVTKNIDWDFEHFTTEQAQKLADRYGDMSMQELAMSNRQDYVRFITHKAVPYVYQMKTQYLQHLLQLANSGFDKNSIEFKLMYDSVLEDQKEYKDIYNTLKRAVRKEELQVAKYNVNSVDEDLAKYAQGKLQIECGNVAYYDMREKAKALHTTLCKIERVEKTQYETLMKEAVNFAAFAKQGKYNVVVEQSDAERVLQVLGRKNDLLSFRKAQANNSLGFTEFGVWAKNKMVSLGIKESDMATKLGVANQRLSDALRGKNKSVEQALKTELKYIEPKAYVTQPVTPEELTSQNGKRKFLQLSPEEQNRLIESRYNHPKNRMPDNPNEKLYTKEQLRAVYAKNNNKWLYDNDLNGYRKSPVNSKVGTMDYMEIKSTSQGVPYYTKPMSAEQAKPLIEALNKANFPYSSVTLNGKDTKFTVRSQDIKGFEECVNKCGMRLGEDHSIQEMYKVATAQQINTNAQIQGVNATAVPSI